MNDPVRTFWQIRLQKMKKRLNANNFETFVAETAEAARKIVLADILPASAARSPSCSHLQ